MARNDIKPKEYHDWCYCPTNPGVLRRIIEFDDEGMPIIEEKPIEEIADHNVNDRPNGASP